MFKKLRQKAKNKKGFTLVELIVVIVIILVLAAVLVPSLLRYVEKANKANCKADAATILSQLQADYAAAQATNETGVGALTDTYRVNGIPVVADTMTVPGAPVAVYTLGNTTDADGSTYTEIVSFAYDDGNYRASWQSTATGTGDAAVAAGWTVTKNP